MSVEKKQGAHRAVMFDQLLDESHALVLKWHGVLGACKVFCYNYINRKITARVSVAGAVGRSCACAEFAHALSDERGAAVRLSRAILDLDHRLRHGLSALAIS